MPNLTLTVDRNCISNNDFTLSPLSIEEYKLIPVAFCGNKDLDEFFFKDALNYDKALICKTYKFVSNQAPDKFLGLVGLSNDSIQFESRSQKDAIPQGKRIRSYPAVKIARLGILKDLRKSGLGTLIMNFLKYFFILDNRTACKYITLDAYSDAIDFYKKQDFKAVRIKGGDELKVGNNLSSMFFHLAEIKTD